MEEHKKIGNTLISVPNFYCLEKYRFQLLTPNDCDCCIRKNECTFGNVCREGN